MCNFYILFSENLNRYYYGHFCDSISEQVRKHYSNHEGFTVKSEDWELVYKEDYPSKTDAYHRELQVKKWKNRKRVEALIHKSAI